MRARTGWAALILVFVVGVVCLQLMEAFALNECHAIGDGEHPAKSCRTNATNCVSIVKVAGATTSGLASGHGDFVSLGEAALSPELPCAANPVSRGIAEPHRRHEDSRLRLRCGGPHRLWTRDHALVSGLYSVV